MLEVLRPGLLTTVQDLGRRGHRAGGVPWSGALDECSLRTANLLVGNGLFAEGAPEDAAALELTVRGPTLRFHTDTVAALVGADADLTLDGRAVPTHAPLRVRAGATLVVGDLRRRARAVLAVHGGLLVPSVLGSAATDLRGAFGGHEGRALARGDVLSFGPAPPRPPPRIRLALPYTPHVTTVRVLPGPESFGPGGDADALTGVTWTVRPESDRMGLRLHGAALPAPPADGASEPVVPGVVQLPPDGQPIVLLADSGTHGGYPRPNVVIGADLARLAGLRGGDRVDFRLVTEAAALAALRERERDLRVLRRALRYAYSRGES